MPHITTQNLKYVLPILRASTTNGGTASGNVDRLGFDYVTIAVLLPTSDNVTNNPSVLKISEADTTDATNFSDITGFVGDTDFTIPNCVTSATQASAAFAVFNLDCRARKRYLKVTVSPTTTQVVDAVAILSRPTELPNNTTEQNALVVVNG